MSDKTLLRLPARPRWRLPPALLRLPSSCRSRRGRLPLPRLRSFWRRRLALPRLPGLCGLPVALLRLTASILSRSRRRHVCRSRRRRRPRRRSHRGHRRGRQSRRLIFFPCQLQKRRRIISGSRRRRNLFSPDLPARLPLRLPARLFRLGRHLSSYTASHHRASHHRRWRMRRQTPARPPRS